MTTSVLEHFDRLSATQNFGRVRAVLGALLEIEGLDHSISIGSQCRINVHDNKDTMGEVVAFRGDCALVMPFGSVEGIAPHARVHVLQTDLVIYPSHAWLGRVLNGAGDPLDEGGALPFGNMAYSVRAAPPPAHLRALVETRLDLGVKAVNCFTTCCRGQRLGVFAGSGVGKSVLLAQFARNTEADVVVVGLIGERGREVSEFLQKHLGAEGLKKSIVVVATSDEPALMRRQAAYMTLAIAEYFRDQGLEVLCLMDSVTRFAMALREIGLSVGEPPATKGYTPSVFAELPRLLERAGPGVSTGSGNITGLFTVLVDGDDHNEPIADTVRSILDGHIVLDRAIGERGRYPAINILRSLSRTVPDCHAPEERVLVARARTLISNYEDMAEMIRLGAYRRGSNKAVDEAIAYHDALEGFLQQDTDENISLAQSFVQLKTVLAPREAEA